MAATILIAGGYGLVGGTMARQLREAHKDVRIILAGRHPERGEALADELGNSSTMKLNLDEPSSLAALEDVDLIVAALKDPSDGLVEAALSKGAAHIGITKLADEIAPAVIAARSKSAARPIVLLGHWQAGVMTMAGIHAAASFSRVDTIEMTALYDPLDPIGPMTAEDSASFMGRALVRKDRVWSTVYSANNTRQILLSEGNEAIGFPMGVLDVPSLAAVTGAASIRFDLTQGDSLGTRSGNRASHDLYIDIVGELRTGESAKRRFVVSDPNGQAHLTALGTLLAIERVLGLDGEPVVTGGVYFPESILSAEHVVARLSASGVQIIEA